METKLYQKATDRATYLDYQSNYPRHCKEDVPLSNAHKFKRICSGKVESEYKAASARGSLISQKHTITSAGDEISRARALNRETLLEERRALPGDPGLTNVVLIFRTNDPKVKTIFTKYFNILEVSERLRDILTSPLVSCTGAQRPSRIHS